MPDNIVTPDMSPEEAARKATHVSNDDWTVFEDHLFVACCDCGLTHRVEVRQASVGSRMIRFIRLDEFTAEIRKRFPEYPKGAVSVVNPQGTEETGTDRPAAPVPDPGRKVPPHRSGAGTPAVRCPRCGSVARLSIMGMPVCNGCGESVV